MATASCPRMAAMARQAAACPRRLGCAFVSAAPRPRPMSIAGGWRLFHATSAAHRRPPPRRMPSAKGQRTGNADDGAQPLNTLFSQRKLPLVGAALAAGVLGFYIMPLLVTYLTGGCREHDHAQSPSSSSSSSSSSAAGDETAPPTGLPPAMDAAAFDASLDVPERIMGITRLRKRLAAAAHGAVLEVAVGTGRNLRYYGWDPKLPSSAPAAAAADGPVTSFTGVDLSADALDLARGRLRIAVPGAHAVLKRTKPRAAVGASPASPASPAPDPSASEEAPLVDVFDGKVRLVRADALQPLPPAAPPTAATGHSHPRRYDTVVQTFGLCSVADPVQLLGNMAAAVQPGTGRIVLLEHGRGRWPAVNALLDRYAGRHFARYGCWWNRDLAAVLARAQAAVPGLEVVAVERPGWLQFGTLWWIELRVRPGSSGSSGSSGPAA